MKLPGWMRITLLATAVMNLTGSAAFLPSATGLRQMGGLPEGGHPLYMLTVAAFILIFGLAYGWAGITAKADRQFIAVGAAGKLAFFALLVWCCCAGSLPAKAVGAGVGDLIFGALFALWLFKTRGSARLD